MVHAVRGREWECDRGGQYPRAWGSSFSACNQIRKTVVTQLKKGGEGEGLERKKKRVRKKNGKGDVIRTKPMEGDVTYSVGPSGIPMERREKKCVRKKAVWREGRIEKVVWEIEGSEKPIGER